MFNIAVFIMIFRSGYSVLFGPSIAYSCAYGRPVETKTFGPLTIEKSFSFVSYIFIASFISAILFSCNPSAIIWGIISVVIYSVHLMFRRWLFTHIFNKIEETVLPSFTHPYTSITVETIKLVAFIVAAASYGVPRIVERMVRFIHFITPDIIKHFYNEFKGDTYYGYHRCAKLIF